MPDFKIISSDGHVIEPRDLWTTRVDAKFKDRAPRMVREEDADWWYCDGQRLSSAKIGSEAGTRFQDQPVLKTRWEDTRLGGYIPDEHVKDMELEGVYGGVIYPTVGLLLFSTIKDSQFLTGLFKAYNDWMADFCSPYPARLKGIAAINLDDVEAGVKELERATKKGLVGGIITVCPPPERSYSQPMYDPFWSAAQDLNVPLSLHVATVRPAAWPDLLGHELEKRVNQDHWVRKSLSLIIYSGVFERFPKLRIGTVEHELSWIPFFLERLDFWYKTKRGIEGWIPFKNGMVPSDFFHRNSFSSFQEDALGIKLRHLIGIDNMTWGWDYPHEVSTFSKTQEILAEVFEDVPENEKRKILSENASRLYGFSNGKAEV